MLGPLHEGAGLFFEPGIKKSGGRRLPPAKVGKLSEASAAPSSVVELVLSF